MPPRPTDRFTESLDLVPLPGSDRPAAEGVRPASIELEAEGAIAVTLVLRRRSFGERPDPRRRCASREQFVEAFGADPSDLDLVVRTLSRLGLTVLSTDAGSRRVHATGKFSRACAVFGTSLSAVTCNSHSGEIVTHRHRTGGLSVPKVLDGIVTAVLGLDDRPQARPQFRVAVPHAISTSYTPVELGEIYRFPASTDGAGQTIAIIELGGGYQQSDLDSFFRRLDLPTPRVTSVGVDGAANAPSSDQTGADGEVLLDIEVAGALAPASSIVVYFAPNTDAGFLDAIAEAAHAEPTPAAISISWGQSEDLWTVQARNAMDDALLDAVSLGVTVTAAAGDNGSSNGSSDGAPNVDFPASSPHAIACGGTTLHATAHRVRSETVWNNGPGGGATGGGVSNIFARPSWQDHAGVPGIQRGPGGRGVPDVAGNADPSTGYRVFVHGSPTVIGGTSAVAPLWAALVARCAGALDRRLGWLQPTLYTLDGVMRDITEGNNGAFKAGSGWDACTGLGVPDGGALLRALSANVHEREGGQGDVFPKSSVEIPRA